MSAYNRLKPYAIAIILSGSAIVAALIVGTTPSEQAVLAARWTARAALPLFLVAYLLGPIYRIWKNSPAKLMLPYRRHWGLAFALSHTIHLSALLFNILLFHPRNLAGMVPGMLAYSMIYIMAGTSNDWSMRKFGRKWRRLHTIGINYIWVIFFAGYASRIVHEDPNYHPEGWAFSTLLLIAFAIRATAYWQGISNRRATASIPE